MHLFIPVFVWNVGQWLGQRKRLSSCAKVIKKTACRRTCEQSAVLHLLQVDASVCEGSSWPGYSWKMNEIIDLSLWETTHEYWALTRDSQRDGNQNEKWGTTAERLRGEKKKGTAAMRRVRWVDEAFHWERWLEERRDTKDGVDEKGAIQNRWSKRMGVRPSREMKRVSDWTAPDDDWRWLVT